MKILFIWSILATNLLFGDFLNEQPVPVTYNVDIAQSKMLWTGYYLFSFGEHHGSIQLSKGELQVESQSITGGYFDIDMTSIKDLDMPPADGGKDLEEHLKSNDFFATDKFPMARFEITKSEKIKDANAGGPNYDITGNLTIKGTKNTLTFPALISFSEKGLRAKAKFKFDRTKWDVHYNSGKIFTDVGDGAISDAIAIELDVVGVK
ncbi:MAG: lipid-binding protein [Marivirga sp.]|nr:lipid-binding protein [Marivirga sp.]